MTIQVKDCCKDFKPNLEKLNGSIFIDWIHGNKAGYTGKKFVYCPWCGKRLEVRSPEEGA